MDTKIIPPSTWALNAAANHKAMPVLQRNGGIGRRLAAWVAPGWYCREAPSPLYGWALYRTNPTPQGGYEIIPGAVKIFRTVADAQAWLNQQMGA